MLEVTVLGWALTVGAVLVLFASSTRGAGNDRVSLPPSTTTPAPIITSAISSTAASRSETALAAVGSPVHVPREHALTEVWVKGARAATMPDIRPLLSKARAGGSGSPVLVTQHREAEPH